MPEKELNLAEFRGYFSPEQYYPDPVTGRSEIPIMDILDLLSQSVDSYKYVITAAGGFSTGEKFVCISLEITRGTKSYTVAGAADGTINVAGLASMALRNAVLRGLGAGSDLPQYQEGFTPPNNGHPQTNQVPQTHPGPQQYQNPQAQSGRNFGPWTGEVVIKSRGIKWNQLPPQELMDWASKGNNLAQYEMDRRGMTQGASQSSTTFPRNSFSGTSYSNG